MGSATTSSALLEACEEAARRGYFFENQQRKKEEEQRIKAESKKYGNEQFSLKLSVGSYTIERKNDSIESGVIESDKEMYRNKNRRKRAAKK